MIEPKAKAAEGDRASQARVKIPNPLHSLIVEAGGASGAALEFLDRAVIALDDLQYLTEDTSESGVPEALAALAV